jgi:hypothetical protein
MTTILNKKIKLQDCSVYQNEDTNWIVKDRYDNAIGEFPRQYSNREMANIIDFAKEFEAKAFLIGQEDAMIKEQKAAEIIIFNLKVEISNLVKENERLSSKLEQLIIGSED